jgi:hypothetical protein
MKLKCNVCIESPTVNIDREPGHIDDMICCPNCDKILAYASREWHLNKIIWKPFDTEFNPYFGITPVTIIEP